ENVSYIETMFTSIPCNNIKTIDTSFNSLLEDAMRKHDEVLTASLLEKLYRQIEEKGAKSCVSSFNEGVATMHNSLHIDGPDFTMRYQNYVVRVLPPADVFKSLVLSF